MFSTCNGVTKRLERFRVHGIDVSHYQSCINWDTVATQKVDFAFMKATEGDSFKDTLFYYNWNETDRVGLMRGAYHFFRPSKSVVGQALNYINSVQVKSGDLPPVLDVEVTDNVSEVVLINRMQSWLNIVESHYNIKPIIYTNQNFYHKYLAGKFDKYPKWIARYSTNEPRLERKKDWDFWQYGEKGHVKGIKGMVDFNVYAYDIGNLRDLTFAPLSHKRTLFITPVVVDTVNGRP